MSVSAVRPVRIDLSRAHVLLVDATPFGLEILAQAFAAFGARAPFRATSAAMGMRIAEAEPLDLIVCDAALGAPDGYDFVHHLRRSKLEPNAYAPVVLTSAHTRCSLVCKARDCGANFMVAKPISPRVMLERVLWIARENRPYTECENYVGPDRRFRFVGPPIDMDGRRQSDVKADGGDATLDEFASQSFKAA